MWKTILRRVMCMAAACILAMLVCAPSVFANPGRGGCDVCTTRALDVDRYLTDALRPITEPEPLVIVRPQRPDSEPEPLVIVRPQRPDSEVEPLVIVRPQRPDSEVEPL
jgi:hypothetical protein